LKLQRAVGRKRGPVPFFFLALCKRERIEVRDFGLRLGLEGAQSRLLISILSSVEGGEEGERL
jgi:hypothetical protein